ncbi:MAG: thioesterase family protein [Acidimicrobiia bacterium]
MSFAEATAAAPRQDGEYAGAILPGWDIFGIANGGYVMAIAARAMGEAAQDRELVSITGYFTNPGRSGPVTVQVQPIKKGRGFSTFRAEVTSNERPLLIVIATYAKPDRKKGESRLVDMPSFDLPPPSECVQAHPSADGPFPPPLMDKVRVMIHPEDAAGLVGERTGKARVRGWFRLLEDEQPDPLAVVLASDAFPPAVFNTNLPLNWTPTLDLTVNIRNPHPGGWLKCHLRTRFVTGGLLEEDGEFWDEENNLVAQSRQLALVPR